MTIEDRDSNSVEDERGEPGSPSSGGTKKASKKHAMPLWLESVLLLGFALLLAIGVKTFLLQAFYIPSESMEPGLVENDRILVQKVSYWGAGSPERGDVVVFKDPGGWLGAADSATPDNPVIKAMSKIGLYPTGGHLVKRVIGVAGDTVTCCDAEGRIMVNGEPIDEPYIREAGCAGPAFGCDDWTSGVIPEGNLFVMGDNRGRSADSSRHLCGPDETDCVGGDAYVPVDLVVGKVFVLLWPASHFTWITTPDAFDDVPAPEDAPADAPTSK